MLNRLADKRIREAMSEGKFDHLPKRGAIDLEEYFKWPEDLRMAYSILKSANCVPEEVELLRDVDRLETAVAEASGGDEQARLRRALADARLKLDLVLERSRRLRAASHAAGTD